MTNRSYGISSDRLREIAAYQPLDFAITHDELVGMASETLASRMATERPASERVTDLIQLALSLAPAAGLYLSIKVEPAKVPGPPDGPRIPPKPVA